jgi:hypothetical protein
MKRSKYKLGLTAIFLFLFLIPAVAQEGYFGKKLGIQLNGTYQRYSERYLTNGTYSYPNESAIYIFQFLKAAKVRVISPEISLNYAFNNRESITAGYKAKRIPVLEILLPSTLTQNITLEPGVVLSRSVGLNIQTFFIEYKRFNQLSQGPTGAYRGIGIEYNQVRNTTTIGSASIEGTQYPVKLDVPVESAYLSFTLNAGRNIPIAKNLLLNIECRFVIPLILFNDDLVIYPSPLSLEFDDETESFEFSDSDTNKILRSRLKLITGQKLNFSVGVQYMLL